MFINTDDNTTANVFQATSRQVDNKSKWQGIRTSAMSWKLAASASNLDWFTSPKNMLNTITNLKPTRVNIMKKPFSDSATNHRRLDHLQRAPKHNLFRQIFGRYLKLNIKLTEPKWGNPSMKPHWKCIRIPKN